MLCLSGMEMNFHVQTADIQKAHNRGSMKLKSINRNIHRLEGILIGLGISLFIVLFVAMVLHEH